MGNSIRCCLACVLPCGALDLIRIVHLNGYVEELTRPGHSRRGPQEQPQPRPQQALLSGRRPQGFSSSRRTPSSSEAPSTSLIPSSSMPEKKRSRENHKKSSNRIKKCGDRGFDFEVRPVLDGDLVGEEGITEESPEPPRRSVAASSSKHIRRLITSFFFR
ncbi:hypothetical protein Acr_28g0006420 [Actinidia rufa]|uniref:Uncharacterized protein n=1 Tax=Actinidia rufa TaxID=165716 RepID=A0A7J0HA03_9ERIC|nr:hypothetical protein Acr_28g0006420 [Actinidia rufa]